MLRKLEDRERAYHQKQRKVLSGSAQSEFLKLNYEIINRLPDNFNIYKRSDSTVADDLQQAADYSSRNKINNHGNM
jgi:23S rRNA maturation mini-RNase III